ncbi:MAG: RHS repeat-associated core domain-containing protein, partial [Verrucomicrobiota bacterium]|nr:RHS repeat-associated core domain-containing protein [Verrucomicrobiota bacterium]
MNSINKENNNSMRKFFILLFTLLFLGAIPAKVCALNTLPLDVANTEPIVEEERALSTDNPVDVYEMRLLAGHLYHFESLGSDDPRAFLYGTADLQGEPVASDDDLGEDLNFKFSYIPEVSGTYYLKVEMFNGSTEATYSLQHHVLAQDPWEPWDNELQSATLLMPDEELQTHGVHFLHPADVRDLFCIVMKGGVRYTFESEGQGHVQAALYQFNQEGVLELLTLSQSQYGEDNTLLENFKLVYQPREDGNYYLEVAPLYKDGSAVYTLSHIAQSVQEFRHGTPESAVELVPTTRRQMTDLRILTDSYPSDYYKVYMVAGATYIFESLERSQLMARIYPLGDWETPLASDSNFKIHFRPPEDGYYNLLIDRAFPKLVEEAAYTLLYFYEPEDVLGYNESAETATVLNSFGQERLEAGPYTLGSSNPKDVFAIYLPIGFSNFEISANGDVSALLYDSSDLQTAVGNTSHILNSHTLGLSYRVHREGIYYLVVKKMNPDATPTYSLTYWSTQTNERRDPQDTNDGVTLLEITTETQNFGPRKLNGSNTRDIYKFYLEAGVRYWFGSEKNTTRLYYDLYNNPSLSSGWVAGDWWGGFAYIPGQSGVYYLKVTRDYDSIYTLKYSHQGWDPWDPIDNTAEGATLLVPTTEEQQHGPHTLNASDTLDVFKFYLEAGVRYWFGCEKNTDRLYYGLYDNPNLSGVQVAGDWWGNFNYIPSKSGVYYLKISHDNSTYTLKYSHQGWDPWDPIDNTAEGATLLVPTTEEQQHGPHTLNASDTQDVFKFYLEAGVRYWFGNERNTDRLYYDLYDNPSLSSGRVAGDWWGNFSYTPGQSGVYYLKVTQSDSTYTLRWNGGLGERSPAPLDVEATRQEQSAITVSWEALPDLYYQVYRSIYEKGTKEPHSDWIMSDHFVDDSAAFETDYYYWVRSAADAEGSDVGNFSAIAEGFRPATFAPQFLHEPWSQVSYEGQRVVFGAEVIEYAAYSYSWQWFKDGEAIEGATESMLFLENVTLADAAGYSVSVSNELGTTLSSEARLTLVEVPETIFINALDQRFYLDMEPPLLTWIARDTEGNDVTERITGEPLLHVAEEAYSSPGYYEISVQAGTLSGANYVLSGAYWVTEKPLYTVSAHNTVRVLSVENPPFSYWAVDRSGRDVTAELEGEPTLLCVANLLSPAGEYPIHIWGGSLNRDRADYLFVDGILTVVDTADAPIILEQPADSFPIVGLPFSLNVVAEGAFRYQWYKDGEPITGATADILPFNAAYKEQSGIYTVEAIGYGRTLSREARVLVTDALEGELGIPAGSLYDFPVFGICLNGDYAYLACGINGLRIVNVADPSNIYEVGAYIHEFEPEVDEEGEPIEPPPPIEFYDVDVVGFIACTATGKTGLMVLDVSNPSEPVLVAWDTGETTYQVRLSDPIETETEVDIYAYSIIDHTSSLRVRRIRVDESGFSFSYIRAIGTGTRANDIYLRADRLYLTRLDGTLLVYDIGSTPDNPKQINNISLSQELLAVYATDHYLFAASGNDGVKIYLLEKDGSLKLVSQALTPGYAELLGAYGNNLYVGDSYGGLQVISLLDPAAPRLVGNYPKLTGIADIAVDKGVVFTTGENGFKPCDKSLQTDTILVRALDEGRAFGADNPTWRYFVTDGVGNDLSDYIVGDPLISSTAMVDSPPGQYPIFISAGSLYSPEYQLTFQNATLTVYDMDAISYSLIIPEAVGRHALATLYVEYENTGTLPITSPVLIVYGTEKALMTLDASIVTAGFWTPNKPQGFNDTIEILASGQTPGLLMPGEKGRVPIYYAGLLQPWSWEPKVDFYITVMASKDDYPMNYDALYQTLDFGPEDPVAISALWDNFKKKVGPTRGDYVSMLSRNAQALYEMGITENSVHRLLEYEFLKDAGFSVVSSLASSVDIQVQAPVSNLHFSRIFLHGLLPSYRLNLEAAGSSALGRGWDHNWNYRLVQIEKGEAIVIRTPGGAERVFQPDSRYSNRYFSAPGDYGVLTAQWNGSALQECTLVEPNGDTLKFDSAGLLVQMLGPGGKSGVALSYSDGSLMKLTHSAGQTLSFSRGGGKYNAITAITDQDGRSVSYTYTADGEQIESFTDEDGFVITYGYSRNNKVNNYMLKSTLHRDGTQSNYAYDDLGRIASFTRADGELPLSFSYGDNGLIHQVDALGVNMAFRFNADGQITVVGNPDGTMLFNEYDSQKNLVRYTDFQGNRFKFSYKNGHVSRVDLPTSHWTQYSWEGGLLKSFTDPKGALTQFGYTDGRLSSIRYADGTVQSNQFDEQSNVKKVTNRRGASVDFVSDEDGRVLTKLYENGERLEYSYSADGRMATAASYDSEGKTKEVIQLEFNEQRLLSSIAHANGRKISYTYDERGFRQSMSAGGRTVKYAYDKLGRLAQVLEGEEELLLASYAYDAAGNQVGTTLGNGDRILNVYDAEGHVKSITAYNADEEITSQIQYTWDLGLMKTQTLAEGQWSYEYDVMGQLVQAEFYSYTPSIPSYTLEYSYDAVGNRTQSRRIDSSGTHIMDYTVDNMNRYTSINGEQPTYDLDGNMTGFDQWVYEYDDENRLLSASNGTTHYQYEYSILGYRSAMTMNGARTEYLVDPVGLGCVIAEYTAGALIPTVQYTQGLQMLNRIAGDQSWWYHYDGIGSTLNVTDDIGATVNHYLYEPFGTVSWALETIPNPFRFVGANGVMDDDNGIHYMRARYYSASLGRFFSEDPLGMSSGDPNLYNYAMGNPLMQIDPSGEIVPLAIAAWAGVGAVTGGATYLISTGITGEKRSFGKFMGAVTAGAFGGAAAPVVAGAGLATASAYGTAVVIGAGSNSLGLLAANAIDGTNDTLDGSLAYVLIPSIPGDNGGLTQAGAQIFVTGLSSSGSTASPPSKPNRITQNNDNIIYGTRDDAWMKASTLGELSGCGRRVAT